MAKVKVPSWAGGGEIELDHAISIELQDSLDAERALVNLIVLLHSKGIVEDKDLAAFLPGGYEVISD